ncbi:MAG: UDP-N-acetylmuramoyl-tripeptide--D-alanyl-D-alanine ligase [Xanthomonadales bacterium]|nr:UDP-N-acetylmuramoyl-tripeptide--D-alanyl-D-alanine ligase [Xanthomonadales bacterium]
MLTARTSQLEHWTGGCLRGEDVLVRGMTVDTRKLTPGELFLAIPGERVDGHQFLAQARIAGAAAALVSRYVDDELPQILVDDVVQAAAQIARAHLRRHQATVIAITGSNGKTTVKNLTAGILSHAGPTLATRGNFNNELGLPLTLARLSDEHRFVVLEMGAGKPGDIAYLCSIAQPDVALVNNVADAHIAQFGSRAEVAETKGAIYSALGDDGVAVINGDDAFAARMEALAAGRRVIHFGETRGDVRLGPAQPGYPQRFVLFTPDAEIAVRLPLLGAHNRRNAAAATALALAAGATPAQIAAGLADAVPEPGRLQPHQNGALTLIDDSYNANPASVAAALEAIAELGIRRWLVLGDMAELGPGEAEMHRQVGMQAATAGFERLYALGPLATLAAERFGQEGHACLDVTALIAAVRGDLAKVGGEVAVLVKGSRAAGMERICQALLQPGDVQCCSG